MAFGVRLQGVADCAWGNIFGQRLLACQASHPERDFLLASGGVPMGYTSMLAQLRRCLHTYADLAVSDAFVFTLHSCKATALSWASQLSLSTELRAAQGHHRLASASVKKYSRDDVWSQLVCQCSGLLSSEGGLRA